MTLSLFKNVALSQSEQLLSSSAVRGYAAAHEQSNLSFVETRVVNLAIQKVVKATFSFILKSYSSLGGFFMGLEMPAKVVQTISHQFHALREKMDLLSPEEREVVLSQIPKECRSLFSKEWKPTKKVQVVEALGCAVAKTFDVISSAGGRGLKYAASRTLGWGSRLLSPLISQERQMTVVNGTRAVCGRFTRDMISLFSSFLSDMAKRVAHQQLNGFSSIPIVQETTAHLDDYLAKWSLQQIAYVVFVSLSDYCRFHLSLPSQCSRDVIVSLKRGASSGLLPSPVLNSALQQLTKNGTAPEIMVEHLLFVFASVLANAEKPLPREDFLQFLKDHNLDGLPKESLLLDQNSFYIRSLGDDVGPEIRFLADLVLLDPKCALINIESACHKGLSDCIDLGADHSEIEMRSRDYIAKHVLVPDSGYEPLALELRFACMHLLERGGLNEEQERQVRAYLACSDGAMHHLFGPQNLLKTVAKLHIKRLLYPQLIECLTPPNTKLLISALGKFAACDIHDKIGTALAHVIVEKGVSGLTDLHTLSLALLKAFGVPTEEFEEYVYESGADPLSGQSFSYTKNSSKALKYQAAEQVAREFQKWVASLSYTRQWVLGSTIQGLSTDLIGLAQRGDWPIWLIFLTSRLAQNLSNPDLVPRLNLEAPETSAEFCGVVTTFLPSLQWIPRLSWFFSAQITKLNTQLAELSIPSIFANMERQMGLQRLTVRVFEHLPKVHAEENPRPYLQEIYRRLAQHIDETVVNVYRIRKNSPAFNFYAESYLNFLLEQPSSKLLETIQVVSQNPAQVEGVLVSRATNELVPREFSYAAALSLQNPRTDRSSRRSPRVSLTLIMPCSSSRVLKLRRY
jgi:hypothetical protein